MRRRFSSTRLLLALLGLAVAACDAGDSRLVDDRAELLTPEQVYRLSEHHRYLRDDFGIEYRVATVRGAGDINQFAVKRFADLEIGASAEAGRGLLLVIDPNQDLVCLEVSYALEGVFPDAFVAYVEHQQMVPFFRSNRVADGILATTELIVARAMRAKESAGLSSEAWLEGSGGAGATASAQLGAGPSANANEPDRSSMAPGARPEDTVKAYLRAMAERNDSPDLALYSPESRQMLRRWTVTPAQMDNIARTYRPCRAEPARLDPTGQRAVIRYPIGQRECAPWFLERGQRGWLLDLTMMQNAVRFGRHNAWHFDLSASHPYAFAFSDWSFDRNGYPEKSTSRTD